jgi:hypothetical protein
MNYKTIILITLLAPLSTTSYAHDTQARIMELRKSRHEKLLKLSELGSKILEKEELLKSFTDKSVAILNERTEIEVQKTCRKKGVSSIDPKEVAAIRESLGNAIVDFGRALDTAIKEGKGVKSFFMNTLYDAKLEQFDLVRSMLIMRTFETVLVGNLIEQYGFIAQEIVTIEKELNTLGN